PATDVERAERRGVAELAACELEQQVGLDLREERVVAAEEVDRLLDLVPVRLAVLVEAGVAHRPRVSRTMYSGRSFTSSWIRAMYSPITPRTISCMPPRNAVTIASDARPETL